jgi:hypothetical protein
VAAEIRRIEFGKKNHLRNIFIIFSSKKTYNVVLVLFSFHVFSTSDCFVLLVRYSES